MSAESSSTESVLPPPRTFLVRGINHLGLAPKDVEKARWFFGTVLGLPLFGEELVKSQQTNTIMFGSVSKTASILSPPRLEILEGEPGTSGPITRFLEKKGSGIHHLAISVSDIAAAIAACISSGVRMVDSSPRPGAHNTSIAFVHPESTGGLLVELVEELTTDHAK